MNNCNSVAPYYALKEHEDEEANLNDYFKQLPVTRRKKIEVRAQEIRSDLLIRAYSVWIQALTGGQNGLEEFLQVLVIQHCKFKLQV